MRFRGAKNRPSPTGKDYSSASNRKGQVSARNGGFLRRYSSDSDESWPCGNLLWPTMSVWGRRLPEDRTGRAASRVRALTDFQVFSGAVLNAVTKKCAIRPTSGSRRSGFAQLRQEKPVHRVVHRLRARTSPGGPREAREERDSGGPREGRFAVFGPEGIFGRKLLALSKDLLTGHGDAEEFQAGRYDLYVNLPNVQVDPSRDGAVRSLLQEPVPDPAEVLLHRAPDPPGNNVILGLASYPKFGTNKAGSCFPRRSDDNRRAEQPLPRSRAARHFLLGRSRPRRRRRRRIRNVSSCRSS